MDHIIPSLELIHQYTVELLNEYVSTFNQQVLLCFSFGVMFIVMVFSLQLSFINAIGNAYKSLIVMLRRAPPVSIPSNEKLVEYLFGASNDNWTKMETASSAIIQSSIDGIIFTSKTGIIEKTNKGFTSILGYKPEQVLGQDISLLFDKKDGTNIKNQMQLMINNQRSLYYDDHFVCMSDNQSEISCHMILLGRKFMNSNDVDSFVIILRNETELIENRALAEAAKKKSESLLFEMLPRDIVMRLNEGDKEIHFAVESASIMFIDIVRFSEFSSSLTAPEIMGCLSEVFASYDSLLQQYPLLTKIKVIGDVYMVASGLFSPNTPHQKHAEQIIKFGIEVLQQLESFNIQNHSNLSVRIGINSGGPIIAGIISTDKPVFDIIGDAINVAARIQSNSLPGKVQISQATYDLVSTLDFEFEERGEIMLKGKGKSKAYFVNSPNHSGFVFSAVSSMNAKSFE